MNDLRFALRQLAKRPGFTVVAVLTLALGIGATTAMFSVVDAVLLRRLPVREQDDVLVMWKDHRVRDFPHMPFTFAGFQDVRERSRTLSDIAAHAYWGVSDAIVRMDGEAASIAATPVSGTFFDVLGVRPAVGRMLRSDDDVPGAEPAVVIGHGLWQRMFGGDSAIIGTRLNLRERDFTIVGVAPEGLEYPRGAEAWHPIRPVWEDNDPRLHVDLVGRLAPGATLDGARAELDGILLELEAEGADQHEDQAIVVHTLAELIVGDVRSALWILSAAVALILIIAGVNVANLLTIRGIARRQELAVRAAIGAGRGRIVRQLLVEALLLGLVGGALGVALAGWGIDVLLALAPAELPRMDQVGMDGRVLAFALGASVLSAVLFGLAPALTVARSQPAEALRSDRRAAGTRLAGPWQGLVIGQVALTLVMLIGAGLLIRTLIRLQSLDAGFETERLVLAEIAPPYLEYDTHPELVALFERLREATAAVPGVAAVTTVLNAPFSGTGGHDIVFTAETQTADEAAANPWLSYEGVDPHYFETFGMPIVQGRAIDATDRGGPPVVVVNATLARMLWGDADAVGRRIKFGGYDSTDPWRTVVGVAGDARYRELKDVRPGVFVPFEHGIPGMPRYLAIRTLSADIVPALRRAVSEIDPDIVLVAVTPMGHLLAAPLAQPKFNTVLLGLLAGLGLTLSAIGIYGVIAYVVASRTHEIGVRMALGARTGDVIVLVGRQVIALAVAGIALGLAGAYAGTRLLAGLLYGVSATDAATFVVVPLIIMTVSVMAAFVPARRAARVDPMEALRYE
jgi:predicted permease